MPGSDIVVKRIAGAAVNVAQLTGVCKIAVIGRSRGKPTADTATFDKNGTTNLDGMTGIEDTIRSVVNVTTGADATLETYYPNNHFVIRARAAIVDEELAAVYAADDIVDYKEFGYAEAKADTKLDWDGAPSMVAPSITEYSTSTSGSLPAGTYWYAVSAFDHSDVETRIGPMQKITTTVQGSVNLQWKRIEHAEDYRVYRCASGSQPAETDLDGCTLLAGGGATPADGGSICNWNDDYSKTYSEDPETVNSAKVTPGSGSACTMNYYYGKVTYDTAKTFTDYEGALDEHGVGSELANVAKLVLDPTKANAPVLITIVPRDTSEAAYTDCLSTLESVDCQFVAMLYAGTNGIGSTDLGTLMSNWDPVYNHCASLSDPTSGQKERYAIFGLPYATGRSPDDIKTFIDRYAAFATKGKRGIIVNPDGMQAQVSTWYKKNGGTRSNYAPKDPTTTGYDLSGMMYAITTVARYAGLRDMAEPGTEKDVPGFYSPNNPFTGTTLIDLRDYGCTQIENRSGAHVISRFINMGLVGLSVEDGELSISVTEDWIRSDLRRRMKAYRGKKMLGNILRAAQRTLLKALGWYVSSGLIAYYDAGSVVVRQDADVVTRMYGFFKYTPVYPVNTVLVEYNFVI